MRKAILLLVILFFSVNSYSQNRYKIDSLKNELVKFEAHKKKIGSRATILMDSTKVLLLYKISDQYSLLNYDTAMNYCEQVLALSEKIGFKKGVGDAYAIMGYASSNTKRYIQAVDYYQKALNIGEELNDKAGIANCYLMIGTIYYNQLKFSDAIKNDSEALKIQEQIGDKAGMINTYLQMADTYNARSMPSEVILNCNKALKLQKETGDTMDMFNTYSELIFANNAMGHFNESITYSFKNVAIGEERKDSSMLWTTYQQLAYIYFDTYQSQKAIEYFEKSLKEERKLDKDYGRNSILASAYISIAYIQLKNADSAIVHLKESKALLKDKLALDSAFYSRVCGYFYKYLGNLDSANYYFKQAMNEFGRAGSRYQFVKCNYELGEIAFLKKDIHAAENYYNTAEVFAKKYNRFPLLEGIYLGLSKVYEKENLVGKAYEAYKQYQQVKDSLKATETTDRLLTLDLNHQFSLQEQQEQLEQVRKDAVTSIEIKAQKRIRNYVLGGLAVVLFFLALVFRQRNRIAKEKKRSDELLLNILPAEVADELKAKGSTEARDFDKVTVMFTDFKGFTKISEQLSSTELVAEINYCFSAFDNIIAKYGIEKIKTIGDSYMCAGGLPVKNMTHADDIVKAALEIRNFMLQYKIEKEAKNEVPFEIRIGINTGPVVAGIVGVKKFAYDIWGDTVNLASRMESSGMEGQVNVSESTYQLVKDKFTCTHRGKVQTKSKGEVDMYFVNEKSAT